MGVGWLGSARWGERGRGLDCNGLCRGLDGWGGGIWGGLAILTDFCGGKGIKTERLLGGIKGESMGERRSANAKKVEAGRSSNNCGMREGGLGGDL